MPHRSRSTLVTPFVVKRRSTTSVTEISLDVSVSVTSNA